LARRLTVFVLVAILVLSAATAAIIYYYENVYAKNPVKPISVQELRIPKAIDTQKFGLFFYDDSGKRIRTTEKNVPFDDNKPTVIYTQGGKDDFPDSASWLDNGYNVGIFVWSQFLNDDPFSVEQKIWGVSQGMRYEIGNGKYESSDTVNYSLAEIFMAYYCDFFNGRDYKGSEIRIEGFSLGAQLVIASVNYLIALEENGYADKRLYPDRITLFDGVFSNYSSSNYIKWLNREIGKDGAIKLVLDTVKSIRKKGTAVEYIRSSPVEIVSRMGSGDKQNFNRLINETCFFDYRSDWLSYNDLDDLLDDSYGKHVAGRNWYYQMISYSPPLDTACASSVQYALSPNTPTSYIFARCGAKYQMNINLTSDASDDVIYSVNCDVPFVAGFAFFDLNGNGINDERIAGRAQGIKVKLYMSQEGNEDKLIGATVTRESGYYELPIEPIYINALHDQGKEFYIKVDLSQGYAIASKNSENECLMMNNDINEDGCSNTFFIYTKRDLKIVDIGLKG
jgi:hypothetical protein